jgi:uracil phosphoribosyltransferase
MVGILLAVVEVVQVVPVLRAQEDLVEVVLVLLDHIKLGVLVFKVLVVVEEEVQVGAPLPTIMEALVVLE